MQTTVVTIPTNQTAGWDSFHSVFQAVFGFPSFYGRNMNAWIDCMTYLDEPPSGMTSVCIDPGQLVAIRIDDAPDFQRRCPEQYEAQSNALPSLTVDVLIVADSQFSR
jgi:Barstar (barnase inhibitor)